MNTKVLGRKVSMLKEFVKAPRKTGAIVSSSPELADLITGFESLIKAKMIVELGSGKGVFTRKIQERKSSDADFFVLEINPAMAHETRRNCPNVTIYQDSAEEIRHYLARHGAIHCDFVVSGLPWAGFSRKLQDSLLKEIYEALCEGGEFVTFAYINAFFFPAARRFRRRLLELFRAVEGSNVVWKNIPPAFVYRARK